MHSSKMSTTTILGQFEKKVQSGEIQQFNWNEGDDGPSYCNLMNVNFSRMGI